MEQEVQNVYTPIEGAETSSTPSTAAGSISMTEIGADSKNQSTNMSNNMQSNQSTKDSSTVNYSDS